jgi:sugar (pentulose or hexulose) kinase
VPLDRAETAEWLTEALARYGAHPVRAIVPVSHGAAVAGVRGGKLAFAPMDYDWDIPKSALAGYQNGRDPFSITGSPALPAGLNFGSQLHYLETLGSIADATLMPYAQYWAWLLSGVTASEVSSLGCHSDLWEPAKADFSPMAKRRGWAAQFAPLARAGDAIGTLRPELAAQTGLSPDVHIYAGLHDSNAALHAARAFPELTGDEATVLSTGTWFIAMRSGTRAAIAEMPQTRDCLVNVDIHAQPVPSARYMGGRELEMLGVQIDRAGTAGVAGVLQSGAMLLPCQVPDCGPFPDAKPRWIKEPADPAQRSAAIALYAALMADAAINLIGARQKLLIEGRFARCEIFVRALASLRPATTIFTASSEADVSFGALRLALPDISPMGNLSRVDPLVGDLAAYKSTWYAMMEGIA